MKTSEYTVKDEAGLHARPAGLLSKCAQECGSDIKILFNGKTGDAKRLFSIMALGVKKDDALTFEVNGAQEQEDCAKLQAFCQENI